MIAPEVTSGCRRADLASPTFAQTAFRPLADRRTYLGIVYLLVSFPLGLCSFVCIVTLLSVGAGLTVTLAGPPIIVFVLTIAKTLAVRTGALSDRLLGTGMHLSRATTPRRGGYWAFVRHGLKDRRAWRDLGFLLLLFPLGLFNFTAAVALLGSSIWMIEQPLLVLAHVYTPIGDHWQIDSLSKALLFPVPGLLLGLGSLHLLSALASVSGAFTRRMLGNVNYPALRLAVARTMIGGRRLDGPAILAELRRYNGCSPDFTPMKVYATLSALEDDGLVEGADVAGCVCYSLTEKGEEAAAAV